MKYLLSLTSLLLFLSIAVAEKKPNIILCMADDQGWGDVGYYGHPVLKTPHLDAMSKAGIRFDRFYAAAPVCSPTRGSVMTGRHPNRFGCFKWGHTLRPQEVTIAEALKQAGYVTGHFGKWHLGSVRKGSPVNPGASGFDHWLSAPNFYDNNPILSREGVAVQMKGESSMIAADAALEFIKEQSKKEKPFLAVVWFGSPHGPHQAAAEDLALYAKQPKRKAHFLGEITGIDRAVGRLRKSIRDLDIHENTIFWYCSDNGGLRGLSRTGGRLHKGKVYEGGLRVPAILEWPARIKNPSITNVPANTVDIYPTILDLVGVTVKKQPVLDGISLVPLLDGKMNSRPKPMGFWDYRIGGISTPSKRWMTELLKAQKAGNETGLKDRLRLDAGKIKKQYDVKSMPGHAAWQEWPWKLHRISQRNSVTWELYNLEKDPKEANDLVSTEKERVQKMSSALMKWMSSVVDSLNGKDY